MSKTLINRDTIKLLENCNAGIKMGVETIDGILDYVKNEDLKAILIRCKEKHQRLGDETHELLNEYNDSDKELSPIAKSMSWIKTNIKLTVNESDNTVADLLTDGCNMGVKTLRKYLNEYEYAEEKVKDIAKRLIAIEEDAILDVKGYL